MPLTFGEALAVASAAIAAVALVTTLLRDRRGEVMTSQAVRDKLDYISDTARDTREDVRALDRKLDDHAARITKIEAKLDDHDRRIGRLEDQ